MPARHFDSRTRDEPYFSCEPDEPAMNSSAQLRTAFLDYFRAQGHEIVASASLVPASDPTLLFTNAGMVPFKDVFLGREQRPYNRAASSQRCVRAGGKHNDLENVGYTARHHTFFEMLGNFSFGDYFKREAIGYAWEFLTSVMSIPPETLWITVFEDDDDAANIWLKEIGIAPDRFARIGEEDNFWSMGDTGPCGPCSEIFYDHGPEVAGGPPGTADSDGDRFVEIWNLVFMQYNRHADGSLSNLPKPSVDTGMGLERLAAVMQGVHSNYDIDLFRDLIAAAQTVTGCSDRNSNSLKVIADHIRSSAFLIVDGIVPSNEGRGYVLRRIIRRAIRHGYELGVKEPFFFRLVSTLDDLMGKAYPELSKARTRVEQALRQEEERFAETLEQGMHVLEHAIAGLSGTVIPGQILFQLYDTYGFPVDLTADIAQARNLEVDMAGFETEMEKQRARGRAASHFSVDYDESLELDRKTDFVGYEQPHTNAEIIGLLHDGKLVDSLEEGQQGVVILDRTPFYAEAGGQAGDHGRLQTTAARFIVRDTQKLPGGTAYAHIGAVEKGRLRSGDRIDAAIDARARRATARNHSATHLLHAALRTVLGEHVMQKGSLVEASRLRFDFAHFSPMTREQMRRVEALVNDEIRKNTLVETRLMSLDDALKAGALAFFEEKYGDEVRVLRMGDFSTELCGGTHVARTGDIGLFKITMETGIAAGVRRIEGVTGEGALKWVDDGEQQLQEAAGMLKCERLNVAPKIEQLMERLRSQEKEVARLQARLSSQAGSKMIDDVRDVGGVKVLAAGLDAVDTKSLRDTLDQLKNKLGSAIIVLATISKDKVQLVAGVTKDLVDRYAAGDLINYVARQVGGKGGGRPDMAQAGGTQPEHLEQALESVYRWVAERNGAGSA